MLLLLFVFEKPDTLFEFHLFCTERTYFSLATMLTEVSSLSKLPASFSVLR